jgi:hypothetical protein
MSDPAVVEDDVVGEAIQSAVELAAGVAAAAGVPPFDVAAAVGGTGTGAEDDDDGNGSGALVAAASVVQASDAGAPAKKKRRTNRKKENPDDVSVSCRFIFFWSGLIYDKHILVVLLTFSSEFHSSFLRFLQSMI